MISLVKKLELIFSTSFFNVSVTVMTVSLFLYPLKGSENLWKTCGFLIFPGVVEREEIFITFLKHSQVKP